MTLKPKNGPNYQEKTIKKFSMSHFNQLFIHFYEHQSYTILWGTEVTDPLSLGTGVGVWSP